MNEGKPMSVGQILARSLTLCRENFGRFAVIVAIVGIPMGILSFVDRELHATVMNFISSTDERTAGETVAHMLGACLLIPAMTGLMLVQVCATSLSDGALTKAASEAYLGRGLTVRTAYRAVFPKLLVLVGASLLVVLIILGGLILLVVPGIIFFLWFALTVPAIVIEDLGVMAGIKRSKALASGNLGRLFVLWLVFAAIMAVAYYLVPKYAVLLMETAADRETLIVEIGRRSMSPGLPTLVMPVGAVAYTLTYYHQRIRTEGGPSEEGAEEG